ncbi:Hypothetical predicted protein, partial [Paramuricea clavata]
EFRQSETSSTQRVMLDSSMSVIKGNEWLDVTLLTALSVLGCDNVEEKYWLKRFAFSDAVLAVAPSYVNGAWTSPMMENDFVIAPKMLRVTAERVFNFS